MDFNVLLQLTILSQKINTCEHIEFKGSFMIDSPSTHLMCVSDFNLFISFAAIILYVFVRIK